MYAVPAGNTSCSLVQQLDAPGRCKGLHARACVCVC
uniref:Uncharacterized protein n=1 Tax=Anopheles albimanus TaxID=7167 RepID=A0A182FXN9_ANOAL